MVRRDFWRFLSQLLALIKPFQAWLKGFGRRKTPRKRLVQVPKWPGKAVQAPVSLPSDLPQMPPAAAAPVRPRDELHGQGDQAAELVYRQLAGTAAAGASVVQVFAVDGPSGLVRALCKKECEIFLVQSVLHMLLCLFFTI